MHIGLFIPCYVDQFYPQVGLATVDVLTRFGCNVEFPEEQTCRGQPMANVGCHEDARPLAERFLEIFAPYDFVVAPSGSCVAMVRQHYREYFPPGAICPGLALARKCFGLRRRITPVGLRWLRTGHSQLIVQKPSRPKIGVQMMRIAPAASNAFVSLTELSEEIIFETIWGWTTGRGKRLPGR